MLDKDKIFLLVYLNVGTVPPAEIDDLVKQLTETLKFDESVQLFIIPHRGKDETTRVECINPVLLDEKQYKAVEKKIKGLKKEVEEKLKTL